MLQLADVFELINNLEHREPIRRYGPGWSVVVVDSALNIAALGRFKEQPTLHEVDQLLSAHKGCAYFYAAPGMYKTLEALDAKVQGCGEAFRINWEAPGHEPGTGAKERDA